MASIPHDTSEQATSEQATSEHATPEHATSEQATPTQLSQALGEAVVRVWGLLPPDVQQQLFEEATAQGTETRSQLALFLHGKHPRTCASIKANAMLEPDSLGG